MIRGVAFDLEGTLVDVERAHHDGHLMAADEVGVLVTISEAAVRFPHFVGGPDEEIAREIWNESDRRVSVGEILASMKRYYFLNVGKIKIALRPGVKEFLECVVAMFPLAIGSLTPPEQAGVLLSKSGLIDIIPLRKIVLGGDVQCPKPAPDVFIETARRMGISTVNQVVFDDSPNGIKAAVAAGSIAVGVVSRDDPEVICALVRAGARRLIHDWREVSANSMLSNLGV